MFKITRKQMFGGDTFSMEIEIPAIAGIVRPGHYVDIHVNPDGTPITLPVARFDRDGGTVTIVHRSRDLPGLQLSMLQEGDEVFQIRGPLGGACRIEESAKVVLAAENLGAASLYCRAAAYRDRGAYTICVLGFETKDDIFWEGDFASLADELYVCTRDSSYGVAGRITQALRAVCETHKDVERIVVIAGLSSMKKSAKLASDYEIPAVVSFDAVHTPAGEPSVFDLDDASPEAFAFAKAPEIDANEVDFEKLLAKRRALRKESENAASA